MLVFQITSRMKDGSMEMDTLEKVKNYYGKVLRGSQDLKSSACCSVEALPNHVKPLASNIHQEIQERFYGCGAPLPLALEGQTVLDLGCGTGRDCYLLSQLVGERGRVIGIDMTEEQLAVAEKHLNFQMDKFGFREPNVRFVRGYIEDLRGLGIGDNSVGVIVSNCVTNLSPDKPRLFSEVFRVLKPGGELYFSDVFADRRLPKEFSEDPVLLGECLGGAMYTEDFRRLLCELGIRDYRVVAKSQLKLNSEDVEAKVGGTRFCSITFRAFKLQSLEDRCEDYGQVAYYQGTIPGASHEFQLDDHHLFKTHAPLLVCSNTAMMLSDSRFGKHFKIVGDLSHHLGLFDCGPTPVTLGPAGSLTGPCC
jgi:arsenite methyltransferase